LRLVIRVVVEDDLHPHRGEEVSERGRPMQLDGCVVVDHAGRGGWQGPCPPSPQFPKKKKKKKL
jgi:hypothetical protein